MQYTCCPVPSAGLAIEPKFNSDAILSHFYFFGANKTSADSKPQRRC